MNGIVQDSENDGVEDLNTESADNGYILLEDETSSDPVSEVTDDLPTIPPFEEKEMSITDIQTIKDTMNSINITYTPGMCLATPLNTIAWLQFITETEWLPAQKD